LQRNSIEQHANGCISSGLLLPFVVMLFTRAGC
jgi:hypothetical protein